MVDFAKIENGLSFREPRSSRSRGEGRGREKTPFARVTKVTFLFFKEKRKGTEKCQAQPKIELRHQQKHMPRPENFPTPFLIETRAQKIQFLTWKNKIFFTHDHASNLESLFPTSAHKSFDRRRGVVAFHVPKSLLESSQKWISHFRITCLPCSH